MHPTTPPSRPLDVLSTLRPRVTALGVLNLLTYGLGSFSGVFIMSPRDWRLALMIGISNTALSTVFSLLGKEHTIRLSSQYLSVLGSLRRFDRVLSIEGLDLSPLQFSHSRRYWPTSLVAADGTKAPLFPFLYDPVLIREFFEQAKRLQRPA